MTNMVSGTSVNGSAPFRLFIFARHGESAANVASVLSTGLSRSALLTERGRAQARALRAQLANVEPRASPAATPQATVRGHEAPVTAEPQVSGQHHDSPRRRPGHRGPLRPDCINNRRRARLHAGLQEKGKNSTPVTPTRSPTSCPKQPRNPSS
jgi:hypothetical protein